MVAPLVRARRGSGSIQTQFLAHHESQPRIRIGDDRFGRRLQRLSTQSIASENIFDLLPFAIGQLHDFALFAGQLAA